MPLGGWGGHTVAGFRIQTFDWQGGMRLHLLSGRPPPPLQLPTHFISRRKGQIAIFYLAKAKIIKSIYTFFSPFFYYTIILTYIILINDLCIIPVPILAFKGTLTELMLLLRRWDQLLFGMYAFAVANG